MPEWTKYIRQNLHLHGLRPGREAEIIEDLAQQLEDAYREALASGMAEAEAAALARQHVPDWDAFNRELQRLLSDLSSRTIGSKVSKEWQ